MNEVADSLAGQAGLLNELLTAAIQPQLQEVGITVTTFELLSAIRASGGKATQIEIARRLGITAPSLCEAVKGVVARGWVVQNASGRDARVKTLGLTPKGHAVVRRVLAAVGQAEQAMLDGIEAEELNRALDTLKRANRNLARLAVAPEA